MSNKDIVFPQYRKLQNNKSFYKIISDRSFEEIQIIGTIINKYFFEVKIYPELLKIKDLIDLEDENYLICSEAEWNSLK